MKMENRIQSLLFSTDVSLVCVCWTFLSLTILTVSTPGLFLVVGCLDPHVPGSHAVIREHFEKRSL